MQLTFARAGIVRLPLRTEARCPARANIIPWMTPPRSSQSAIPLAELTRKLDAVPDGPQVMLELTIPDVPALFSADEPHGLPTP